MDPNPDLSPEETDACILKIKDDSDRDEIDSYCELTFLERQNSQNEEKEAERCSRAQVSKQTESLNCSQKHYSEVDSLVSDTGETTVINIDESLKELAYHERNVQNKSKHFASGSDWTESDKSGAKVARSRTCSRCLCTISISAIVSICVSACITILLVVYLSRNSNGQKETIVDNPVLSSQLSSQVLRNSSSLQKFLARKTSRAQLYLDQDALRNQKKLIWSANGHPDAFMSQDLSTSVYKGKYGCLDVSQEGVYSVFSKVTFYYRYETETSLLYHSMTLLRTDVPRRQLSENRYTLPTPENRSKTGRIYWPSVMLGYYHLKPEDRICITVRDTDMVYQGQAFNYFSVYLLADN